MIVLNSTRRVISACTKTPAPGTIGIPLETTDKEIIDFKNIVT